MSTKVIRDIPEYSGMSCMAIDNSNHRLVCSSNDNGLFEVNLFNYKQLELFNEFKVPKAEFFHPMVNKNLIIVVCESIIQTFNLNNGMKIDRLCRKFDKVTVIQNETDTDVIYIASLRGISKLDLNTNECNLISELNLVTSIQVMPSSLYISSIKGITIIEKDSGKELNLFKKDFRQCKKLTLIKDNLYILTESKFIKLKNKK